MSHWADGTKPKFVTPYPICKLCDWWWGEDPNGVNAHVLDWKEQHGVCNQCRKELPICVCNRHPLTSEEYWNVQKKR